MKVALLIIASIIVMFVAAFGYDMYGAPQFVPAPLADETLIIGKTLGLVPDFSLKSIDGKDVSISDLRGRVVIINFWATWCATCVIEMPDILNLVNSYSGKVVFLAISSDSKLEYITRFINNSADDVKGLFHSDNVYVSWDRDGDITYDIFMTERFPETIIIAPNGEMVRKIIGEFKWGGQEIKQYLDKVIDFP